MFNLLGIHNSHDFKGVTYRQSLQNFKDNEKVEELKKKF